MRFNEREAITDPRLLKQSLAVLALVILGFMLQRQIQIEPATIAIFGAAVLLLLDNLGKDAETQSHNVHARAVRGRVDHADVLPRPLRAGLRRREGGPDRHHGAGPASTATGGDFTLDGAR